MAGKYRTGKSYLLNRSILGNNYVFKVGNTVNACTKGLWMYDHLIEAENGTKFIVVDTEGLSST